MTTTLQVNTQQLFIDYKCRRNVIIINCGRLLLR